jgi:aminopeptidase N
MAHPVKPKRYAEINNFYTATVYEKGSELIRMMASWLGREGFTKGLQLYLKKFDGRAATTEDFVSALEQGSGQSLAPLISWYDIPGTPEVSVETKFLKGSGPSAGATTVTENTFEVTLAQDNPKAKELGHKQYLQTIPLNFKLFAPSGAEVEVREQSAAGLRTQKDQGQVTNLFVLDQEKQSYRFSCLEQPILSLNRDFSAPVHIHYQRSLADSLTLFAHEQDPYAKFDAGQRVALDLIRQRYLGSADHAGEQHYLVALGQVLSQWRSDPAFLAKMIKLPPLVQTLQFERQVDLVKMDQAIQGLYQQMANTHQLLLMDILSQCHDMASKIPWSEGVGFRAMKLSCLSLLSRMRNQTAAAVIEQTYRDATNMTESFGAFALLMDAEPSQARDEWESHFFQKWQHEYLVINKWFQAIASSRSPDAYSRFKALCLHPAFSLQNPNRCRALIGGFVRGNLVHYHGHNGEPYQSVLQLIREIDGFNPQLAAALAKASTSDLVALTSATRKDLRQTLSRVMDGGANPVSKDLAEIVQRTQEFFATLDGLKS